MFKRLLLCIALLARTVAGAADIDSAETRRGPVKRVDLLRLASVDLPPRFELLGMVNAGPTPNEYTLETLRDPQWVDDTLAATFLLEQDQGTTMGGYSKDPVLLTLTLYNAAHRMPDAASPSPFRVHRYHGPYGGAKPPDDSPRWTTETEGARHWRWLELVDEGEKRWGVVLIDPLRQLRLDFYAWQRKYSLREARALLRATADSVQRTPELIAHFERAASYDSREKAEEEDRLGDTVRHLKTVGLAPLRDGVVVSGTAGAALLQSNIREVCVAYALGSLVLPPDTPRSFNQWPELPLAAHMPKVELRSRGGWVNERLNLSITMLYWDASGARWRVAELQSHGTDPHIVPQKLMDSLLTRATDRRLVYLYRVERLVHAIWSYRPREAGPFLVSVEALRANLKAGNIVPGVTYIDP